MPRIGPGVSHDLDVWRAAYYSDVRYKLNLTLEKMSPVLKGTIEIIVNMGSRTTGSTDGTRTPSSASSQSGEIPPIILDWRKIAGHEKDSTISNVSLNGVAASPATLADEGVRVPKGDLTIFAI